MEVKKLEIRAKIIKAIREFFWHNKFIETDTPIMVAHPGMEPYLDPFKTQFKSERGETQDMYLITSPEYAMKRLLASGFKNIFQITHTFRNKEVSATHNPEFAMLEWYRTNADYKDIMRDTENMIFDVCRRVFKKSKIKYQGVEIDLKPPFERLSVVEAFKKYAGVDKKTLEDEKLLKVIVIKKGYSKSKTMDYSDAFFLIFLNEIERKLGAKKPVFLYDYPLCMAALSKQSKKDKKYAERFELYIAGLELANAFSELIDAKEQRVRLEDEQEMRRRLKKEVYSIDEKFISALEYMSESGGIALGVDRLVMLFTDSTKIDDIMFCGEKFIKE
ncbi:MAG: tRNA synthetase class II (D K and N), lysyl-tRNA synthetase, class II [Candidatus Peregrinibacteria bacterium GW2011_GWC2_39_14]|nr:MAG: tRNA synthetase class II (D K and N), lysyl-tRNA synthetase, class II [Candidatus Peregrinibacteria bacterium GW2011_GWC2_39_14]